MMHRNFARPDGAARFATIAGVLAVVMAANVPRSQVGPSFAQTPYSAATAFHQQPPAEIRCRRVCVKTRRPSGTAPPACLSWRIVC
jgi:hypothetical protein